MKLATRTFKRDDWYITCPYGERINPVTHKKDFHSGDDYGTHGKKWKQYSLEEGIVTRVGYNSKGYGHYFDIQYPRIGMQCFYAHLDKVYVKEGQKVDENTCIGLTGTTGMSTGIHLHLGIKPIGGEYINPEKYDYIPPQVIPVTEPVPRDEQVNQLEVIKNKLRVRTEPSLKADILDFAELGIYNDLETIENDGYVWHKIADNNWLAEVDGYVELLPKIDFKVGDFVETIEPVYLYQISAIEGEKAILKPISDISNLRKIEK